MDVVSNVWLASVIRFVFHNDYRELSGSQMDFFRMLDEKIAQVLSNPITYLRSIRLVYSSLYVKSIKHLHRIDLHFR